MPSRSATIYGCLPAEAALLRQAAPHYGIDVAITSRSVADAAASLTHDNPCISVDHRTPVDRATLRVLANAGVRYLCTRSVGDDHIDLDYASRVGIAVDTVDYSPASVADFTIMLMLMALRDARGVLTRVAHNDYQLGPVPGRELGSLTVGVVGTGRIGTAVIHRLRGFGCDIRAYDPGSDQRNRLAQSAIDFVDLDDLLRHSDIVTLHVPNTPATHHLIDRDRLRLMRSDALIVNTSRGSVIDTQALASALQNRQLGGVALDVIEDESSVFSTNHTVPLGHTNAADLHQHHNALITPHTAYYTDTALRDIVHTTLANCANHQIGILRHG